MATYEHRPLMSFKDKGGDKHLMYPITKADCVDGLDALLAGKETPAGAQAKANVVQGNLNAHVANIGIHVKKSILVSTTLSANSWTGSSAPYSYTFTNANISATCPVELLKGSSMTAEQLEALQAANIQGGTQAAGSIQLLAYGDKPSQNLPVLFVIRGDL